MSSLGRAMMEAANEVSEAFKADKNYTASREASSVDTLINNIHHGYYPHEWFPRFVALCETHPSQDTEGFKAAYAKAIEVAGDNGMDISALL